MAIHNKLVISKGWCQLFVGVNGKITYGFYVTHPNYDKQQDSAYQETFVINDSTFLIKKNSVVERIEGMNEELYDKMKKELEELQKDVDSE